MKFFAPLLCLLSASVAAAAKCGSGITTPCRAESDTRFDASTGYELLEEAQFWGRLSGYYEGYDTLYNVVNNVPTPDTEEAAVRTFLNITVGGSRVYMHRYGFVEVEGVEKVLLMDTYYTATFEKDGSVRELGRNSNEGRMGVDPFRVSDDELEGQPFGPYTGYFSGEIGLYVGNVAQEFYTCLSQETGSCSPLISQVDMYLTSKDELKFSRSKRFSGNKISEEAYVSGVSTRIQRYGGNGTLDVALDACATQECPTEEQWEMNDPYYNESPYLEPNGSLEGWFIAVIVVICALVVCAAGYFAHHHALAQREERIKDAFAQSIARTISHRVKAQDLTPEDLKKEFELVDEDGSGKISKEEFRHFIMGSDKVHLDDRDFDVLYHMIDMNHDGEIDFSEFCAFFNTIRVKFNSAVNVEC